MNDQELRRLYQEGLLGRPVNRASCPAPDDLRALADREGLEHLRLATLDHVMGCADCREEYELLAAVAAAREARHRPQWPLLAAAALLLTVGGGLVLSTRHPAGERADGTEARLTAVAPAGTIRAGPRVHLVWSQVPDAFSYRAELLAPDGALLHAATTGDTTLALPPTIDLITGETYHWWVSASLPEGRELRSPVQSFQVAP